jgi:SHS2 domain-containing protein
MGMVISGDDYIFYYKYNSGVIKIKDGKEYQISDDGAYAIQYANDYIYYTTPNISGGIDIKKVSQNGDTNVVLTSVASASTKMYLEDGYLYYTTTNPDTISKIDINGENESVVLTRTIYDFKVLDSTIYFTDSSEHLYKIDTNGENYEELSSNPLAKRFQIVKNGVYYFDADVSKLLKFDLDSKQISEVTDKLNCDIYNVTSDGIYYLDSENLKICFVDLNNKNSKEIVTVSTANTKLNIQGTILYYLDITEAGDYIAKRISTTGKSLDEIKY